MDIPVLLEPTPTGWRATTGAPLNLVAEGPDKDSVLVHIRAEFAANLRAGASVTSVSIPVPLLDLDAIEKLAAEMSVNPFFDEWMKGIAEYRAEVNIPPEADEECSSSVTPSVNDPGVGVLGVAPVAGS